MRNATINGQEYTLFYDYDQLENGYLENMSDDDKIEWFRLRMKMIFLQPLEQLFDHTTKGYKELNSHPDKELPKRTFTIASFSVLLNGIESLGAFVNPSVKSNKQRFLDFLETYMKSWQLNNVKNVNSKENDLFTILWKDFRNGIAHGFMIKSGGVDLHLNKKYKIVDGMIQINPKYFFNDFKNAVDSFFHDVKNDPNMKLKFLKRFKQEYPH